MSRSFVTLVLLALCAASTQATLITQPLPCVGGLPIVGGLTSGSGGALGLTDLVGGLVGTVEGVLGGLLGGVTNTGVCAVGGAKIDVSIDLQAVTLAQLLLVNQTFLSTYGLLGELTCLVDSVVDLALCAVDLLLLPGCSCSRACYSILHQLSPTCWNSLLAATCKLHAANAAPCFNHFAPALVSLHVNCIDSVPPVCLAPLLHVSGKRSLSRALKA